MRQANRLVLAFIICLTAVVIAVAGTHIVSTSSENPQNNHSETSKVFVKVVVGMDEPLTEQQQIEEWIVHETSKLGSPYALGLTDWIQVTESKQEIYASMRGGRIIEARLVNNEQPSQVTVEITGLKIVDVPLRVTLQHHDGVKQLNKITNYPGANNIFVAFRVGGDFIHINLKNILNKKEI